MVSLTLVVVPYLFYWRGGHGHPTEITASPTSVVGLAAFPSWTLWGPPGRLNTDRCILWVRALPVSPFDFLASWAARSGGGCCCNSGCCALQFGELAHKRVHCYYYKSALSWLKVVPHVTMQHVTTFHCSLGVLTGVGVLWRSPSQDEYFG